MKTKNNQNAWIAKKDYYNEGFVILRETKLNAKIFRQDRIDDHHGRFQEKDARLIAAAPDLLAALEDLLDCADPWDAADEAELEIVKRAKDAIKKAKGEA